MSKTLARITRANITLAQAEPFCMLSGLVAALQHHIDNNMPSAYTDGVRVGWNDDFVAGLDAKELAFVVAHEAAHSFFMHNQTTKRLKPKYPDLVPIAVDQVVNNFLIDCDPDGLYITMPAQGILDRKYQGMDTYQVLQDLLKNPPKTGGQPGFDEHLDGDLSPEEEQDLKEAIEQGRRAAARSSGANRTYQETHTQEKNYAELLSQWLYSHSGKGNTSVNWRAPNRRLIHKGIYFPARQGKNLRVGVLTVDTSGSIQGPELDKAVAIMKAIVAQVGGEELHVIYWDSSVTSHETYKYANSQTLRHTQPKGGGGTCFAPVLAYLAKHRIKPDVMVSVTDGYIGDWGNKPDFPALWLITTPEKAPWGEVLHI